MPNEEQTNRILHQILNQELRPVSTDWRENFGDGASEEEIISRGLSVLASLVPEDMEGALHGWIDQAVLEIVAIGRLVGLRDQAKRYRPDQGGDSGVLVVCDGRILVLEFAFERGEVSLSQFKPIQLPEPTPLKRRGSS